MELIQAVYLFSLNPLFFSTISDLVATTEFIVIIVPFLVGMTLLILMGVGLVILWRRAKKEYSEIKEDFTNKTSGLILEIQGKLQKVETEINELAKEAKKAVDTIEKTAEKAAQEIKNIETEINELVKDSKKVVDTVEKTAEEAAKQIKDVAQFVDKEIEDVIKKAKDTINTIEKDTDEVINDIKKIAGSASTKIEEVVDKIELTVDSVKQKFDVIPGQVKETLANVENTAKNKLNIENIPKILPKKPEFP